MRIITVINWAPYPSGSSRYVEQLRAVRQMVQVGGDLGAECILAVLPREPLPPVAEFGLEGRVGLVVLPRDAHGRAAGPRHLPYLRDVLDAACSGLEDSDWGGLINSDILVTPALFRAIQAIPSPDVVGAVIAHRTDILKPDSDPAHGQKVNRNTCTDGYWMRAGVWRREGSSVPDFILGEPWWDTGMIWWTRMKRLPHLRLTNHEILHVRHRRFWSQKSTGATWNSQLGRNSWRGK